MIVVLADNATVGTPARLSVLYILALRDATASMDYDIFRRSGAGNCAFVKYTHHSRDCSNFSLYMRSDLLHKRLQVYTYALCPGLYSLSVQASLYNPRTTDACSRRLSELETTAPCTFVTFLSSRHACIDRSSMQLVLKTLNRVKTSWFGDRISCLASWRRD